jgi:uncharacterized protein
MQQPLPPREIVLGFFADINAGKFEEALARLAEDVQYEVVSPPPYGGRMDRNGLSNFMASTIQPRLADPLHVEILGVTASDDRVAVETRTRAKGKGGRDYDNRFHFLCVVRDGLIVEAREYLDSAVFIDFVR